MERLIKRLREDGHSYEFIGKVLEIAREIVEELKNDED